MPPTKETIIKVRCSTSLKERLTLAAATREQDVSEFVRASLLKSIEEHERRGYQSGRVWQLNEPPAASPYAAVVPVKPNPAIHHPQPQPQPVTRRKRA